MFMKVYLSGGIGPAVVVFSRKGGVRTKITLAKYVSLYGALDFQSCVTPVICVHASTPMDLGNA